MDGFVVPRALAGSTASRDGGRWLAELPAAVDRLRESWDLEIGAPFEPGGQTAWVAPARHATHGEVVVKLTWPHFEADHEGDGLGAWNGDGAVLLLAVQRLGATTALLLERCRPGIPLSTRHDEQQDEVVCALPRRLWIEPPADSPVRPLALMCDAWADEFEKRSAASEAPVDPGLSREAMSLFRTLPRDAERQVLLCTDLHGGNVLAAEREPWLAIDPKPFVGDPTYDVLQHLLNSRERLHADPSALLGRIADLAGLDADRLRRWIVARCVQESPSWPDLVDVARQLAREGL